MYEEDLIDPFLPVPSLSSGILENQTDSSFPTSDFSQSDITNQLLGVFDNGLQIYNSVMDRLTALAQIGKDTVAAKTSTASPASAVTMPKFDPQIVTLIVASIVLLVGIFFLTRK